MDTDGYQLTIPRDVSGRLKSLEEIFSSLHVKSEGCRKRFVCHLAKVKIFTPDMVTDTLAVADSVTVETVQ